jgi:hypothetical protein
VLIAGSLVRVLGLTQVDWASEGESTRRASRKHECGGFERRRRLKS